MKRYYECVYPDYTRRPYRILLLAVALLFDIVALICLVRACSGAYSYFAGVAAWLPVTLALRIPSLRMAREWIYVFDGGAFSVKVRYPNKTEEIFSVKEKDFRLEEVGDGEEKSVKLYCDPCGCGVYVIKLSDGKRYMLALNEYMLALLNTIGDEERDVVSG